MTDIHNIRNKLSEVTGSLIAVRQRRAALNSELNTLAAQETAAQERAASLRAELLRLEPPAPRPEDLRRLAGLTATLSAKLAKLPTGSPTGEKVRGQLERLNDETKPVSDRLSLVRSLLDSVSNAYIKDRELWDKNTPRLSGRGG